MTSAYAQARIVSSLPAVILFSLSISAQDVSLHNQQLSLIIQAQSGSYELRGSGSQNPILRAVVGAQIDYHWRKSNEYPNHEISQARFKDDLGSGQQVTVSSGGLADLPDLEYVLKLYDTLPFGDIEVQVKNHTNKVVSVQSIRVLEATGEAILDLGGAQSSDRILSDSFSENWPAIRICDLNQPPRWSPTGMHRGVGSQLIYNRESNQSIFFGALSARRFLTYLRLQTQGDSSHTTILSYNIDSSGTTEIHADISHMRTGPPENLVSLSLAIAPGQRLASELVMFAAGDDYHSQLESYGKAIRALHHARVAADNLLGWWSWTSHYLNINDGNAYTNAQWLAQHLKALGYEYFHIDDGYEYALGEYTTPNAAQFPRGMRELTTNITRLGLKNGVWTAPFQIGDRSWVYEHHKDWLVHTAQGKPIRILDASQNEDKQDVYVLDTTHPGAQHYLRETYRTLVREWGIRYIKLDFMDNTSIEGQFYRPDTTALDALKIGVEIIRTAVGDDVLLDKDGSPMLTLVGLVDTGRISQDTGHSFRFTRTSAPGIAARYYMNRNFFISDPDAFNVQRQVPPEEFTAWGTSSDPGPLSLGAAEASIVLAAVSGGMFEIGDDLPTVGTDEERLALITNQNVLQMAQLSQAAEPLDLMTYRPEDDQPSIFFLREDRRQSMLAVFNWTNHSLFQEVTVSRLKLPATGKYRFYDALDHDREIELQRESLSLQIAPESVRLIKIIDHAIPASAPILQAVVPANAKVGQSVIFSVSTALNSVPALAYHWDFGDGVGARGSVNSHTYTMAGKYTITLTADGVDGKTAAKVLSLIIEGVVKPGAPQRYIEPAD